MAGEVWPVSVSSAVRGQLCWHRLGLLSPATSPTSKKTIRTREPTPAQRHALPLPRREGQNSRAETGDRDQDPLTDRGQHERNTTSAEEGTQEWVMPETPLDPMSPSKGPAGSLEPVALAPSV